MDYGHTNPQGEVSLSPEEQAFFTAGVGNAPASENVADVTENLNTNQNPWDYTPEHDHASIGNKIISNPEMYNAPTIQPQVEYGQIIPMTPQSPSEPVTENQATIYDVTAIVTRGDHLDKKAVSEVKKLESKLSSDHDLNSFYSEARKLTSVNLKNSYNRELGKAA